jgi:hypothetical protein
LAGFDGCIVADGNLEGIFQVPTADKTALGGDIFSSSLGRCVSRFHNVCTCDRCVSDLILACLGHSHFFHFFRLVY